MSSPSSASRSISATWSPPWATRRTPARLRLEQIARQILEARVHRDRGHDVVRPELARDLQRGGDVEPCRYAGEDPLLPRQPPRRLPPLGLADRACLVVHLRRQMRRDESDADSFHAMRAAF